MVRPRPRSQAPPPLIKPRLCSRPCRRPRPRAVPSRGEVRKRAQGTDRMPTSLGAQNRPGLYSCFGGRDPCPHPALWPPLPHLQIQPLSLFLPPAAGIVASDLSQGASPPLRASCGCLASPILYCFPDSYASFKARVPGSFLLSSLGLSGSLKPHVSLVV